MQARELSSIVHGKKIGKEKWLAKCPSHYPDRKPSLSIMQGKKGILIKCWSGCDTRQILDALGLTWDDLFTDTDPDRDHLRRLKELEAQRERERREKRRIANLALEKAYAWDAVVSELGRLLAAFPDDSRLADLFHRALDSCRRCESIAKAYHTEKTWGNGIVTGCAYKWPIKVRRDQVDSETAMRLGL